MQSLTQTIQQLDRRVKVILRGVDEEMLTRAEKQDMSQLKLAMNEVRLDVRDYEYAQTREEQLKWAKIAQHNLKAVNALILRQGHVFNPADVAELGAVLDMIQSKIV